MMKNFVENKIQNHSDTPALIYILYFILLLITLSWTNTDETVAPNIILRITVTVLLIVPLLKYYHLTPTVIALFSTIRVFSVAPFGYIPTEMYYFLVSIIFVFILILKKFHNTLQNRSLYYFF